MDVTVEADGLMQPGAGHEAVLEAVGDSLAHGGDHEGVEVGGSELELVA